MPWKFGDGNYMGHEAVHIKQNNVLLPLIDLVKQIFTDLPRANIENPFVITKLP